MILKEAHTKFIENLGQKNKASATVIAYKKDLEQLLAHLNKNNIFDAKDVTDKHIKSFMEGLLSTGYTPKSISRKTNSTKTFFKYLHEEIKIISSNPSNLVTHPKLSKTTPRVLTKMEYSALRDVVKTDIRTSAILEILLQCGIRISELSNIRINDIKIAKNCEKEQGSLHIPKNAGAIERDIPLNTVAQKTIIKYLEIRPKNSKEFLFVTKTGKQLLIRNIRSTLAKYFNTIGLKGVKVNDLRHTFISYHLQIGTPIYVVSKIAGHKRISTTEKYLDYIEVSAKKSTVKLEEL
ncbi:tyrosine-type recombinase/integrase [Patescibacteria group bacterium]|nr:tyrosine-type recombinase/integrase [Patescibacteria group bacterium]